MIKFIILEKTKKRKKNHRGQKMDIQKGAEEEKWMD